LVRKVQLDHKVPQVSLDFRELTDNPVAKVFLETLDLWDHKDL